MKVLGFMQWVSVIALFVIPILIVAGDRLGLGFYDLIDNGGETALWVCVIALLIPLALGLASNMFWKSATDSALATAGDQMHPQSSINQRQHLRYPLTCIATFSNDERSGFGMLVDISPSGCRLKTKLHLTPGDSGRLLINVPTSATALEVAGGVVRWAEGSECGIEFMTIGPPERRFLEQMVQMIRRARRTQVKEASAILMDLVDRPTSESL